jgi:hypothetical protein
MRRIALLPAVALAIAVAAPAAAGGPPGIGFYVDGDLYRTIGTPTDLSNTGAPDQSYDTIYALGGDLMNVADAAPGFPDYDGGRWQVTPVTWIGEPEQLKSEQEVFDAADDGLLTIGEPVKFFVCPAIPANT